VLFATSIADNIRYGKPDATMEEVMAAARVANAASFIQSFPEGFDTLVRRCAGLMWPPRAPRPPSTVVVVSQCGTAFVGVVAVRRRCDCCCSLGTPSLHYVCL
jgi:hypothetical protein